MRPRPSFSTVREQQSGQSSVHEVTSACKDRRFTARRGISQSFSSSFDISSLEPIHPSVLRADELESLISIDEEINTIIAAMATTKTVPQRDNRFFLNNGSENDDYRDARPGTADDQSQNGSHAHPFSTSAALIGITVSARMLHGTSRFKCCSRNGQGIARPRERTTRFGGKTRK